MNDPLQSWIFESLSGNDNSISLTGGTTTDWRNKSEQICR